LSNGNGIVVKAHVNLNGIGEKLMELEPKISRSLLRKALKAVGIYWVEAVKSHVPVLLGDLKKSITSVVRTRKGKGGVGLPTGSVEVGPGYAPRTDGKKNSVGPGVYGMFVEFGLNVKKYAKHPFMRPTFDSTAEQAVDIFADTMKAGFEEAIRND
jgi:HK97 gp10 family phage protein